MPAERIQPPGLNNPPTYSHVVKAGDTVYNPGQVAQDEQGQLVGRGDITAQATQVFENPAPIMAGRLRIGASDLPKGIAELREPYGHPGSGVGQAEVAAMEAGIDRIFIGTQFIASLEPE